MVKEIIKIENLKKTSELWIKNEEHYFLEDEIYYINPNIISENLYYDVWDKNTDSPKTPIEVDTAGVRTVHNYEYLEKELEKNGWQENYPAKIIIGKLGEIFLFDGNHRFNMVSDKFNKIPITFCYAKKNNIYNKELNLRKEFIGYRLFPKWERGNKMKIAIVGSRRYENKRKIKEFIFKLKQQYGENTTIVSGGCKDGADKYAKKYALELGLQYEEYPPFHEVHNMYCTIPESRYGKPYNVKYFFARNKIIAGTSDMVVGFIPDGIEGRGTMNTISYAKKFEKKYIIIS